MEDTNYRDDSGSRLANHHVDNAVPSTASRATRPAPRAAKPSRPIDESAWLTTAREANPFQPLARLLGGKHSPLAWGNIAGLGDGDQAWFEQVQKALRTQRLKGDQLAEIARPLPQPANAEGHPAVAMRCLSLGYLLPLVAKFDKSNLTAGLVARLLTAIDLPANEEAPERALGQLWLGVELPLVLASFSPDAKTAAALRRNALSLEARLATTWLDSLVMPKFGARELLLPWLASLVRSHELLRGTETAFSETARERLERLARHALRLSRADGSSILRTNRARGIDQEFLTAVVLATKTAPPIAELALGKHKTPPKPVKGMVAAPVYSPEASLGILRTRWAAPAVQTTADFAGQQVWLDVSSGNQPLLHGHWQTEIKVDGQVLQPTGSWSEVCWNSDPDCDYLEIEQKLSGGWLLQRHLMLVRRDECLLLADSLLNETKVPPTEWREPRHATHQLEYTAQLPLAPAVSFVPQQESREGHLWANKKPLALVLPLAMPEWRKQPFAGELTTSGTQLNHTLRTGGRNLFAPVWFDLNPARFKQQYTWRQLTIGEQLLVQPRDVAVGYRVQVNYTQWLLYRSLAWRGNRTVLGKNFATDFVACRFLPNGETQDILEVQ